MQTFEVGHLRRVTSLDERFKPGFDQRRQAAAEYGLLTKEIRFRFFAKRAGELPDLTPIRALCGMLLWLRSDGCALELSDIRSRIQKVIRGTIGNLTCPYCNKRYSVRESNLRLFFQETELNCFGCGRVTCFLLKDQ